MELVPNGLSKAVTEDNKREYLNALAHYRLYTRVKDELEFFTHGLNSIIPADLLAMFDEKELEVRLYIAWIH